MATFPRPDLQMFSATRAAAVKAGRRPPPEAARSGLDGREHVARLALVGSRVFDTGRCPWLSGCDCSCLDDVPCAWLVHLDSVKPSYLIFGRTVSGTRMPYATRQQAMSGWDHSLTTVCETRKGLDHQPTPGRGRTSAAIRRGCDASARHDRSLRHHALRHVAPQRDRQLACHRDDRDPTHA